MLKRNGKGNLNFDSLGFELFVGGLFDKCKNCLLYTSIFLQLAASLIVLVGRKEKQCQERH